MKEREKIDNFLNKIHSGNNVTVMNKIPDNSIDLTITSPPYDDLRDYNNKLTWNFEVFKKVAKQLYRITKNGGTIVWIVGDKQIRLCLYSHIVF